MPNIDFYHVLGLCKCAIRQENCENLVPAVQNRCRTGRQGAANEEVILETTDHLEKTLISSKKEKLQTCKCKKYKTGLFKMIVKVTF